MDLAKWQSTPVYISVNDIINSDHVTYQYRLTAVLHTPDQDYIIYKVISEDIMRDYLSNMMDDVIVKVKIPLGDYIFLVYPNKDNLEITLTRVSLNSIGDGDKADAQIEEIRYKCVFDPINRSYTTNDISNYSQETLNTAQIIDVTFRLIDRNAEPLRIKMVQGIYRGVTAKDLMMAVLLGEAQNIQVDGSSVVTGIDISEPDNSASIGQIVLTSGTHICEVPTLLQERYAGVYKYGIGTFYQRYKNKPMWFVYPLYDFNRFDGGTERDIVIFYFAPPKFTKNVETTFRVNSGMVEAVITTEKFQQNSSDVTQINDGVGFRMMDNNAFMKKPVVINKEGIPIGARGNLNTENSFINRMDGLNYAPFIRNISTNGYHELSKVSTRQATVVTFGWENSDENLIYPGMPTKLVYVQDNEVCEIKGTILGIHATRIRIGTLSEADRFITKCIISVATELNVTLPVYKTENSFDPTSNQNN